MHITHHVNASHHTRRHGQNPAPASTRPGLHRPAASPPVGEHDPTLLIAALEDVESMRVAIEAVREADLLRLCLV